MGFIKAAKAYSNNEVALVAWTLTKSIPDCRGFEITRIYLKTGERTVLPAWVPFKGQSNPKWLPQTTSVWPIQKLYWRDLTLRKRRDKTERRPSNVEVKYLVRPVVPRNDILEPVVVSAEKTYEGKARELSYADKGVESNPILITPEYGQIHATFTNGILAAQWLKHALETKGEKVSPQTVIKHMETSGDPIREYLMGDVFETLTLLLESAKRQTGSVLNMSLYELKDKELVDAIVSAKGHVDLILSNSGKNDAGEWDAGNAGARTRLQREKVKTTNRMFNNNHIGHNKFVALTDKNGKPKSVMTGSTNWTSTGLCGQSNNALIINSPEVADQFLTYWGDIHSDTSEFTTPKPRGARTRNVQGPAIRTNNLHGGKKATLEDGTEITTWFSPNTLKSTKGMDIPPDLGEVYSLMRRAERAIFFAVFLPGRSGKTSIIEQAIQIGTNDRKVLVYGAISDVTAMPNYVAPPRGAKKDAGVAGKKKKTSPRIFDDENVHIVLASALKKDTDLIGAFEAELLTVGHAIIHDKIVVIDPLSDNGLVVMGSHNLGYKASYENDENLLIIRNNKKLIEAYAVHILDVYDHYRFRAVQLDLEAKGKNGFEGFLSTDSTWLDQNLAGERGALAKYFGG